MDRINRIEDSGVGNQEQRKGFFTMKELKGMKRGGHCRLIKSSEEKN
jgi:hypothetical protein